MFSPAPRTAISGIFIAAQANSHPPDRLKSRIEELGLSAYITTSEIDTGKTHALHANLVDVLTPGGDTTRLCGNLALDSTRDVDDLEREILLTLLAAPRQLCFPSQDEFDAMVRMRMNIVRAARRTQLAFDTASAERPAEFWSYDEERGFTIRAGKSLITALEKATQPDENGHLYSFSCYRATEYVILLGMAQELARSNPALLDELQQQWECRAIKSGAFHDTFLHEYGSFTEPLPLRYYVPGDRVWFRNPDERSSDVTGYEGSWVIYLGHGLFSNFWQRQQPYTLESKCVEIFHWRDGLAQDSTGEWCMDEAVVAERVRQTQATDQTRIINQMLRLRDAPGRYADGGCIDASREFPRWVCPDTADIALPTA